VFLVDCRLEGFTEKPPQTSLLEADNSAVPLNLARRPTFSMRRHARRLDNGCVSRPLLLSYPFRAALGSPFAGCLHAAFPPLSALFVSGGSGYSSPSSVFLHLNAV